MRGPTPESADGTNPLVWRQRDGVPVACKEKLSLLQENLDEVRQVCQDAFEDAILMGVNEEQMRNVLVALVMALRTPRDDR